MEKGQGDTSLQEKLKAAADTNAVVEIAKEAGFVISAEDLTKAQSEFSEKVLEGADGECTIAGYAVGCAIVITRNYFHSKRGK